MKSQTMNNGTAYQRVRTFLRSLERGAVTMKHADRIRDDLYELVSRVEKMQERFPEDRGPELSPDVCSLLKRIDQKKKLVDRFPFLKAASFL